MARCIVFLPEVLEKELVGTPLLSIVRLLHVAANRMSNVEALAVSGDGDGTGGVGDLCLQAIGKDPLHPDCAFMVELLSKLYQKALGDVKKARLSTKSQIYIKTQQPMTMAPSPAPGDEAVRKKVNVGDDPLAMMQPFAQPSIF